MSNILFEFGWIRLFLESRFDSPNQPEHRTVRLDFSNFEQFDQPLIISWIILRVLYLYVRGRTYRILRSARGCEKAGLIARRKRRGNSTRSASERRRRARSEQVARERVPVTRRRRHRVKEPPETFSVFVQVSTRVQPRRPRTVRASLTGTTTNIN